MLAMSLEITSTWSCWAIMPVAAMLKDLKGASPGVPVRVSRGDQPVASSMRSIARRCSS